MNRNQRRAMKKSGGKPPSTRTVNARAGKQPRGAGGGAAGIGDSYADLYGTGLAALQGGDFAQAEQLLLPVAAAHPGHGDVLFSLGKARLGLGRAAEALAGFDAAIAADRRVAAYHRSRGAALKALGRTDEAAAALVQALERDPAFVDAHFELVVMKRMHPELPVDMQAVIRVIDRKAMAQAYVQVADILQQQQKLDEALQCMEQAVMMQPDEAALWARQGGVMLTSGRARMALDSYRTAIRIAPDHHPYRINVLMALRGLTFAEDDPEMRAFLREMLDVRDIEYRLMTRPWLSLFRLSPEWEALRPLMEAGTYEDFAARLDGIMGRDRDGGGAGGEGADAGGAHVDGRAVFSDPFLLAGVEKLILPDPALETFLTRLRRWLLARAAAGDVPHDMGAMLRALSIQCFFNEYVYDVSAAEEREAARLAEALVAGDDEGKPGRSARVLAVSCYRPLYEWADGRVLEAGGRDDAVPEDVVRLQWTEPQAEREIAQDIPVLSPIVDDVSLKVQAQYEENPYPRWRYINKGVLKGVLDGAGLRPGDTRYEILVAGCGTGRHPLMVAQSFVKSDVLAVDLSRASLAYAARKTREMGVGNLRFMQADILELERLGRRFDIIESAGVLHHMDDPEAGWRVLAGLLKPGGHMFIGLYSEAARRHIVQARAHIAEWGLGSDAASIRAGRQRIMAMTDDAAMRRLVSGHDFYTMSTCRDLIFHVQEHRFTLPRIAEILGRLDLSFLSFAFQGTEPLLRYRRMFGKADGTCDFADLRNWEAYEEQYPETFSGMYQFMVRRGG